mgnify:FL=1
MAEYTWQEQNEAVEQFVERIQHYKYLMFQNREFTDFYFDYDGILLEYGNFYFAWISDNGESKQEQIPEEVIYAGNEQIEQYVNGVIARVKGEKVDVENALRERRHRDYLRLKAEFEP